MNHKLELLELLDKLPAEKLPEAVNAIRSLLDSNPEATTQTPQAAHSDQALHELLTAMIGSITNSLYDLSTENERAGAKILANRLDFSRMKILESWDSYRKKRSVE